VDDDGHRFAAIGGEPDGLPVRRRPVCEPRDLVEADEVERIFDASEAARSSRTRLAMVAVLKNRRRRCGA
jgi:hypothetical protein